MVFAGAAIGLGTSLITAKYIRTLLYEVKPGDPTMLAIQFDPSEGLRTE